MPPHNSERRNIVMAQKKTPSEILHASFHRAYNHFNRELFDNRLPKDVVIILHRKRNALGYFWANQWSERGSDANGTHEIAMNPSEFRGRSNEDILSTLVHEMCHLQQQVEGKPSRNGYHNAQWANMMLAVGLIPVNVGNSGGKMTGLKVSHKVQPDGRFQESFRRVKGIDLPVEAIPQARRGLMPPKPRKVKFTCPECAQEASALPDTKLKCGVCDVNML